MFKSSRNLDVLCTFDITEWTLMACYISHKEKKGILVFFFTFSIIVSALSQLFPECLFLPFAHAPKCETLILSAFSPQELLTIQLPCRQYEKHNVQPITKQRSTFSCEHFKSYLNTLCFITTYPFESTHLNIS